MTKTRARVDECTRWMSAVGLAVSLAAFVAPARAQRAGGGNARAGGTAHTSVHQSNANVNRNANVNQNTNVNRNVNVNQNVDVNRSVHVDDHYDRWGHPIAATAAVVAVGTMVAALPPSGCSGVSVGGVAYSHCGSTYYQPVYSGSNVTYVVVNPP